MQREPGLRLGYIPYLNCVPYFHYLRDCGFSGSILPGVPSALNCMLQNGEIDVSPSSSFEYALNSRNYLLLPDYSISSCGAVKSVLLFSPCPPPELQNQRIAITGDSATSINLLRVLLLEFSGLTRVDDYVPQQDVEGLIAAKQPALLIGDRAMVQAAHLPDGMVCYDLAELWYQQTGLPFVFALWILRRTSALQMPQQISALQGQLGCSLDQAFSNLPLLARQHQAGQGGIGPEALVEYWQTIDYRLTEKHLKGLALFFQLCHKHRLLAAEPEIVFFQPQYS